MLTRREVMVRKLISKFHENLDVMKKGMSITSHGFDPNLAERTRAKDARTFTKEEKEWVSIDKVLHPEVCPYVCSLT